MSNSPADLDEYAVQDIPPDVEPLVRRDSKQPDGERTPLLWAKAVPANGSASEGQGDEGGSETIHSVQSGSPQSLLLPFFVYCTAMGAVAVPKLNVILALMCVQYDEPIGTSKLGEDDLCNTTAIHKRMAQFMMCAHMISGFACALASPRIGALSDRYGRKPLLAFTAVGLLFGDVISILAAWHPHKMSVYWILLEFGIGGLSGTFSTTLAVIQAYVVDSAEEQCRVKIISRYHAAMFLGIAIGPVTGELFVRTVGQGDMLSVFYAAALCHAAFIAFVLLVIQESLSRKKGSQVGSPTLHASREPCSPRSWGARLREKVSRSVNILRSSPQTPARSNLPILASIDGLAFGIQLGSSSVLIMYAEYRFDWKGMQANWFIAITNGVRAVVLTMLLPMSQHLRRRRALRLQAPVDPTIGQGPEGASKFNINIIRLGLVSDIVSYLGFAVANTTPLIILSGVPSAAGAAVSPIAQALMTSFVELEHVGELFGTVSMIHALVRIVVPASMQFIYRTTLGTAPAAVFVVLAIVYGGVFALSLALRV